MGHPFLDWCGFKRPKKQAGFPTTADFTRAKAESNLDKAKARAEKRRQEIGEHLAYALKEIDAAAAEGWFGTDITLTEHWPINDVMAQLRKMGFKVYESRYVRKFVVRW